MKRLTKLIIISSCSLMLVYGTIWACSDSWGWIFDSNFAPEAFVEDSYKPLFLSDDYFYNIMYDNNQTTRFSEEIKKDWQKYFNTKLDTSTVNDLVFVLNAKQLNAIKKSSQKKVADSLQVWVSKLNIKSNSIGEAIDYLIDAKKVEEYSTFEYDYWDYESQSSKKYIPESLVKQLIVKYETAKESFLKSRYWYLANKAYFYSSNPAAALPFFEKTKNTIEKNYLYYSALAYIAGTQYKNKNYLESNYLYSIVFNECVPMRVTATYNYHPLDNDEEFESSLTFAKTNDEKTSLWALQGYYTDEIQAIEQIYNLDPKSPHLDFLLSRVINKTEKQIYSWYEEDDNQSIEQKTIEAVTAEKYNLLKKIAQENKTAKPYFWNISIGYLEFLKSNFTEAKKYYELAEKSIPQTQLLKDQIRLLKLINSVGATNTITQLNTDALTTDLHWLYKEQVETDYYNNPPLRTYASQKWIATQLTKLFAKENNLVYKELIHPEVEYYQNSSNLLDMKNFLQKSDKTPLEKFLTEIYIIQLDDIHEYEAIRATFENRLSEAISFMSMTTNLKNTQLAANPFNGFIKDCHDCEFAMQQKKHFTKLEFLQTMQMMQEKIKNNEDVFNNSLLLGNAFYNISHFGNARLFYQGNIIPSWTTPFGYDNFNRKLITNNNQAEIYYQKALQNAENKEQKAKAFYMLSKCERNEYYNRQYYFSLTDSWALWDLEVNFLAWNGFKELKQNYSDTRFYQQVINECGYFSKFAYKSN